MSGLYRDAAPPTQPCPRCGSELGFWTIADAAVDECSACGGIFLHKELLQRFLDPLDLGGEVLAAFPEGKPSVMQSGSLYIKCPICRTIMNRQQFAFGAKLVVDICSEHGIWFDTNELRAAVSFAELGGLERATQIVAERRRKEERKALEERMRSRKEIPRYYYYKRNFIIEFLLELVGL